MGTRHQLPHRVPAPEEGSPELAEALDLARHGVLRLGTGDDGRPLDWNLRHSSHLVASGTAGSGKGSLVDLALFYAASLPDQYEMSVVDPHGMEYTAANDLANCTTHAVDLEEFITTCGQVLNNLRARYNLLDRFGVTDLDELADTVAAFPHLQHEVGPIPKHHLLILDAFEPLGNVEPYPDVEKRRIAAMSDLETIIKLGRAVRIHVLVTTLRWGPRIVSPSLDRGIAMRIALGHQNVFSWAHIFPGISPDDPLEEPLPKGRGWVFEPHDELRRIQLWDLGDRRLPVRSTRLYRATDLAGTPSLNL